MAFLFSLYVSLLSPTFHDEAATAYHAYGISPLGQFDNGYPEERYNEVIQTLKDVYDPIIAAEGGEFKMLADWGDGAVNMWAYRWGNDFWLEVPGGMSRYYLINEEAFILSMCHELGHLLGGVPKRGDISLEGQSDYYATLECVNQVLVHVRTFKELQPTIEVSEVCKSFTNKELKLCERAMFGALSLTSYYSELESSSFPTLSTPSEITVVVTLESHPPAQCRLDTFFAGYVKGPHPACWYSGSGVLEERGRLHKWGYR